MSSLEPSINDVLDLDGDGSSTGSSSGDEDFDIRASIRIPAHQLAFLAGHEFFGRNTDNPYTDDDTETPVPRKRMSVQWGADPVKFNALPPAPGSLTRGRGPAPQPPKRQVRGRGGSRQGSRSAGKGKSASKSGGKKRKSKSDMYTIHADKEPWKALYQ